MASVVLLVLAVGAVVLGTVGPVVGAKVGGSGVYGPRTSGPRKVLLLGVSLRTAHAEHGAGAGGQ